MELRKLIREILSVVLSVDKTAEEISKKIVAILAVKKKEIESSRFPQQKTHIIDMHHYSSDLFFSESLINSIIIKISLRKDEQREANEVSGSFLKSDTKQHSYSDSFYYDVSIDVDIYNYDFEENLTKKLNSVVNHELRHAFEYVKKFGKKSVTSVLNPMRQTMRALFPEQLSSNKYLKYFMDVFYFNLPEERGARVQQLYSEIKDKENINFNQIISYLGQFSAFRDFTAMKNFDAGAVLNNTQKEDQVLFIETFNRILHSEGKKIGLSGDEMNYPKDPEKFFRFWEGQFHKNADIMRKKVIKFVANLKDITLKENFSYIDILDVMDDNSRRIILEGISETLFLFVRIIVEKKK